MKTTAWLALLASAVVLVWSCSTTGTPTTTMEGSGVDGSNPVSAGVTGTVEGETFSFDQALITTQHRMLGLALYGSGTDPDMANLAPGSWYLGIKFQFEEPGPALTTQIVNYGHPLPDTRATARLIHVGLDGKKREVPIAKGALHITDWTELRDQITRMYGSVDITTVGDGHLRGTFSAPVRGWYMAP